MKSLGQTLFGPQYSLRVWILASELHTYVWTFRRNVSESLQIPRSPLGFHFSAPRMVSDAHFGGQQGCPVADFSSEEPEGRDGSGTGEQRTDLRVVAVHRCEGWAVRGHGASPRLALTCLSSRCRSPSPSTWGLPVASCKGEKLPSEGGWARGPPAGLLHFFGWLYCSRDLCPISEALYSWQKI